MVCWPVGAALFPAFRQAPVVEETGFVEGVGEGNTL